MKSLFYLSILFLLFVYEVVGQDQYHVTRISGEIVFDGRPIEPIWETIEPLPLTMYTPVFQGDLSEKTEIRLAYDDHFIYASGKFYDTNPKGIMGNSLVRDVDRGGDFFNILLDTYNDNESVVTFSTTPAGNRLDAQITNDAEGGRDVFWNGSWNAFWDAKVTRDNEGWYAEMRIPFSSLRFQDEEGKVVFGLIAHRLIGRKNERQTYPKIPPNWDFGAWKASRAKKVVFEGIYQRKPLYITPYILSGIQTENQLVNDGNYQKSRRFKKEAGLDVKYGLSSNFNLDLTVNTDFAQVEADDQQVNLTRFSLFFPEKRQFFQERAGIFAFTLGDDDRLFYSRTIGISSEGVPLRMLGGLRLTGRANNWDIGLLNAQIDSKGDIPSTNFGIVRLRKRVFNQNSFIGSMVTSKVDERGNKNFNYGIDGVVKLFGSTYYTLKFGQTRDSQIPSDLKNNSFLYSVLERRAIKGFGYQIGVKRLGLDFDPSVGFTQRKSTTSLTQAIWYGFFQNENSKLRVVTPSFYNKIFLNNSAGNLESQLSVIGLTFGMMSGTSLELFYNRNKDNISEPFILGDDVEVLADNYTFHSLAVNYTMTDGRLLRFNLSGELGDFYNGDRVSFQISPIWTISKHFGIGGDFIYNRVKFPQRDQVFKGNIGRVRLTLALNSKISFDSFWQIDKASDIMKVNLRARYNFREGNDLYVVFNQGNNTGVTIEKPDLISQSLLVKYTYTFIK